MQEPPASATEDTLSLRNGKRLLLSLLLIPSLIVAQTASELADQGDVALRGGDYRTAVYYYRQSLEKNPAYLRALNGSGFAYYSMGDFTRAENDFRQALKLDPKNKEAMTGTGRVLVAKGDFNEARKFFDAVYEMDPGNLQNNFAFGEYHRLRGKLDLALLYYKKVLRISPSHQKALIALCTLEMDRDNLKQAEIYWDRAREIDPSDGALHAAKSKLELKLAFETTDLFEKDEHLGNSRVSALRALQLTPRNAELQKLILWIDLMRNDVDGAVSVVENIINTNESDGELYYLAATLFRLRSYDLQRVASYYEKAIALNPLDSLIRFSYEEFVLSHGNGFPIGGDVRKKLGEHHLKMAKYMYSLGRTDMARTHFNRSLLLLPDNREAMMRRMEKERLDGNYESYYNDLLYLTKKNPHDYKLKYRLESALNQKASLMPFRERLFSPDVDPKKATYRRTPTRIFIYDLEPLIPAPAYPDAGGRISRAIIHSLSVPGRVTGVPAEFRERVFQSVRDSKIHRTTNPYTVTYRPEYNPYIEELESPGLRVHYTIKGFYKKIGSRLSIEIHVLEKATSRVVKKYSVSASGKNAIFEIAQQIADQLRALPFEGRVIKVDYGSIFVNVGRVDGVKKGDMFLVQNGVDNEPGKIQIEQSDYFISRAKPIGTDWTRISKDDRIVPAVKK